MKSLSALLLVLLLCSLQLTCRGSTEGSNVPVGCCFKFTKVKIPVARISSHWWTNSNCPVKAVIFKTILGKKFCVDPSASWVKEHMKKTLKQTKLTL